MPGAKSCFSHKRLNCAGVGMGSLLEAILLVGRQKAAFREASSLGRELLLPLAPKQKQPRAGECIAASQGKWWRSSQEVSDGMVTGWSCTSLS